MKRYSHMFLIAIVAVAGISVFYIKSAQSASGLPQFMIERQSGDRSEMKHVKVFADYLMAGKYDRVELTTTGTTYASNGSFLNRMNNLNGQLPEKLKHMQDEYHGFMRGKRDYLSFFENREVVVYATVPIDAMIDTKKDFQFQVALLNKKDEKQSSYEISIPNQTKFSQIYVEDVQMIDEQLFVTTTNTVRQKSGDDSYSAEYHIYTIDLSKNKTVKDKTILANNDSDGPIHTNVYKVRQVEEMQSNSFVIFNEGTTKEMPFKDGSTTSEKMNQKIVLYNLENEKKEEITGIEKGLKTKNAELNSYNQTYLYFTENQPDGVKVMAYNFKRHALEEEFVVPLRMDNQVDDGMSSEDRSTENGPVITINGHKIYMLTPFKKNAEIAISDLRTGKLLYKGIVKPEKNDQNKGYELSTNGLEVSE